MTFGRLASVLLCLEVDALKSYQNDSAILTHEEGIRTRVGEVLTNVSSQTASEIHNESVKEMCLVEGQTHPAAC